MLLDSDEIEYDEPGCLMCDDTGYIEDPDTDEKYPCCYCDAYTKKNNLHKESGHETTAAKPTTNF